MKFKIYQFNYSGQPGKSSDRFPILQRIAIKADADPNDYKHPDCSTAVWGRCTSIECIGELDITGSGLKWIVTPDRDALIIDESFCFTE